MRSQDGARNPWSAPTTELWAPTRIRALLYAGKPNWALLETLTPT